MHITACGGSARPTRLGTLSRRRSMLSTTSSPDSPTCPAESMASQTAPMFLGSFALRPGSASTCGRAQGLQPGSNVSKSDQRSPQNVLS